MFFTIANARTVSKDNITKFENGMFVELGRGSALNNGYIRGSFKPAAIAL